MIIIISKSEQYNNAIQGNSAIKGKKKELGEREGERERVLT